MASFSRSSFVPKRITISPDCRNEPVVLQLKSINNAMRKIDAYVLLGLKGKRKLADDERKQESANKRKQKESALERQRKASPINFIKERLPKTGFLDAIKNFILYTAMGMMVPFVLKNLPTILSVSKLLIPAYEFIENFFGNVLVGIVNVIDFSYKVHDNVRGLLKNVTGNKVEKEFDELEKNLNTFLNLAVVLGLTVAGSGGEILKKPQPTQTGGAPPTTSASPQPSLARRVARKIPGARAVSRIPAVGKFARLFTRVPVVGGLISFAISMLMGEKIGRAAARAVGTTAGAALGLLVPFPVVGTILGGFLGDIVGGGLYDVLEAFNKPKQKLAAGGKVNGKRGSKPTRQIRKVTTQKPQKQIRQRTVPGKNVGGEDNIKKLFPETEDEKTMSPLRLLKKNINVMKSSRSGVLGALLSSGVEMMVLGQKIERPTLMGLEKYLSYVIDSSIQDQSKQNVRALASSMFAMADGGIVPVSRSLSTGGTSTGSMVAKEIVKSFTAMLNNRSVEIFQNIRRELELKSPEGAAPAGEPGEGGGLQVTSSSPDFWLLATAALFENNNPASGYQGAADVAQAIYNRVAMPGDPWKVNGSIRTAILNPEQFQPVTDYGGAAVWDKIKDKESAIAFVKSKGRTQEQLESVSAALLDTTRQNSARTFVGPRDSFRSYDYENKHNHLADDTEVRRQGHAFGFEPRGATIASFRAGRLKPAEINKQIVTGKVENLGSRNVTLEEIRLLAERMGLEMTSHYRNKPGDRLASLHYSGLAMDFSNGIDTPQQLAFAKEVAKRYGKNLAELIYTPLGYGIKERKVVPLSFWDDKVNRSHYNHVHVGVYANSRVSTGQNQNSTTPQAPGGRASRPPVDFSRIPPVAVNAPIRRIEESFSVTKNGKKFVFTRARVNNFDVYTKNGQRINDEEFWDEYYKRGNLRSEASPLKIASGLTPQQQNYQDITNRAIRNDTASSDNTMILIQPTLV